MAKEAIKSIKDVEEEARLIIKTARESSRDSQQEAVKQADQEYKKIILEAEKAAKKIKDQVLKETEINSQAHIEKGNLEAENILKYEGDKFQEAVNFIVERVVRANGNS